MTDKKLIFLLGGVFLEVDKGKSNPIKKRGVACRWWTWTCGKWCKHSCTVCKSERLEPTKRSEQRTGYVNYGLSLNSRLCSCQKTAGAQGTVMESAPGCIFKWRKQSAEQYAECAALKKIIRRGKSYLLISILKKFRKIQNRLIVVVTWGCLTRDPGLEWHRRHEYLAFLSFYIYLLFIFERYTSLNYLKSR